MRSVEVLDVNTHKFRLPHGLSLLEENTILLNSDWWDKANEWEKRKVVYHEMGHFMGLTHDTSRPNIMDSNIKTANSANWLQLVKDFKRVEWNSKTTSH